MENQIAVITISLTEWNEQRAIIKDIADRIRQLTSKEEKELLTPKEVCSILKIGRASFERYKNEGLIPVTKINSTKKYSKNLVKRSDLEILIKNGLV